MLPLLGLVGFGILMSQLFNWIDPATLLAAGVYIMHALYHGFIGAIGTVSTSFAANVETWPDILDNTAVNKGVSLALWFIDPWIPAEDLIAYLLCAILAWWTTEVLRVAMLIKGFFWPTGL